MGVHQLPTVAQWGTGRAPSALQPVATSVGAFTGRWGVLTQ